MRFGKDSETFLDSQSTLTVAGNGINLYFRKIERDYANDINICAEYNSGK